VRPIAQAALLSAVALAGLGSPGVLWAEPDTIPLKELPQNSRLAIWGDSITETTEYPRYVEVYLLACAGRKDIKVCTFGHSGERIRSLISRQSDLEFFHPTIVSFNYGMNDSEYSAYTEPKGAGFNNSVRAGLAMLAEKGIKQVVVVGPDGVDDNGKPETVAHNLTLLHFRDFARAAAVESGAAYADTYHRMIETYNLAKKDLGPTFGLPVHPAPAATS